MNWTKEQPKWSGFYWVRNYLIDDEDDEEEGVIVVQPTIFEYVALLKGGGYFRNPNSCTGKYDIEGEFYGPITPPPEED